MPSNVLLQQNQNSTTRRFSLASSCSWWLWSHIDIDFVPHLLPSEGSTVILTIIDIIDRLTKAAHSVVTPMLASAFESPRRLVDNVLRFHSITVDIVCDRCPGCHSYFNFDRAGKSGTGCSAVLLLLFQLHGVPGSPGWSALSPPPLWDSHPLKSPWDISLHSSQLTEKRFMCVQHHQWHCCCPWRWTREVVLRTAEETGIWPAGNVHPAVIQLRGMLLGSTLLSDPSLITELFRQNPNKADWRSGGVPHLSCWHLGAHVTKKKRAWLATVFTNCMGAAHRHTVQVC